MENTYLGILRGKIMPMEISAMMLLKGSDDAIFFLETKQMSGYTTKITIRNALRTAMENNPRDEQLAILLGELRSIRISEDYGRAAADVEAGYPVLDWMELKI